MHFKPGVTLDPLNVGGAHILVALAETARELGLALTITSGTDGTHSGPGDPHYRGEAFDVRSHGLTTEQQGAVLQLTMHTLAAITQVYGADPALQFTSGGLACDLFFGFLEAANTPNEHFHFQVRNGRTVPPMPAAAMA